VMKARKAREEYLASGHGKILDVLYLLTNEQGEWLDRLKEGMEMEGWSTIRTSRDLVLDQEQFEVNGAIDADIARKAAVFVGNGVRCLFLASLTLTNISFRSGLLLAAILCTGGW
jgi:hypothetical protein